MRSQVKSRNKLRHLSVVARLKCPISTHLRNLWFLLVMNVVI